MSHFVAGTFASSLKGECVLCKFLSVVGEVTLMTYYLECENYLYSFDTGGLTQLLITRIWYNFLQLLELHYCILI